MNPRIHDGGLQLGASCRNWPHDIGHRDIDGGIPISVIGIAAGLTDKGSLTLAVLFCTVSAHMAHPRRVTWVHQVQWDTGKSSLVG